MRFFRSEEAVRAWTAETGQTGEVVPLQQLWALAQAWYSNRLHLDFHGRSLEEAQAIFRQVGLSAPFWFVDETV